MKSWNIPPSPQTVKQSRSSITGTHSILVKGMFCQDESYISNRWMRIWCIKSWVKLHDLHYAGDWLQQSPLKWIRITYESCKRNGTEQGCMYYLLWDYTTAGGRRGQGPVETCSWKGYLSFKSCLLTVAKILLQVVMCLCVQKEMGSSILKWFGFRKWWHKGARREISRQKKPQTNQKRKTRETVAECSDFCASRCYRKREWMVRTPSHLNKKHTSWQKLSHSAFTWTSQKDVGGANMPASSPILTTKGMKWAGSHYSLSIH